MIVVSPSLRRISARSPRSRRLICFPHGGGSARYFAVWQSMVPDGVELWAVQYPRREERFDDAYPDNLLALAQCIAAELLAVGDTAHLTLFGHSFGASVAHEVTMTLARVQVGVEHLVVSARPPATRPAKRSLGDLSTDELRQALMQLHDGETALSDDSLWETALPALRADLECLQNYRRSALPRLPIPITALGGRWDLGVDEADLSAWSGATSESFALHQFDGGHFYLDDQAQAVIDIAIGHGRDSVAGLGAGTLAG